MRQTYISFPVNLLLDVHMSSSELTGCSAVLHIRPQRATPAEVWYRGVRGDSAPSGRASTPNSTSQRGPKSNAKRALHRAVYLLFTISYFLPWGAQNGTVYLGISIMPFSAPYLAGIIAGLIAVTSKRRLLPLVVLSGLLGVLGVLLVSLWWYGLALHYVAGSGVKVTIEFGAWVALASSLIYIGVGACSRL